MVSDLKTETIAILFCTGSEDTWPINHVNTTMEHIGSSLRYYFILIQHRVGEVGPEGLGVLGPVMANKKLYFHLLYASVLTLGNFVKTLIYLTWENRQRDLMNLRFALPYTSLIVLGNIITFKVKSFCRKFFFGLDLHFALNLSEES